MKFNLNIVGFTFGVLLILLVLFILAFRVVFKGKNEELTCIIADASMYNPIVPDKATYNGSAFKLSGDTCESIFKSFTLVGEITPHLSAPAWFVIYCGNAKTHEGDAFVFSCDGSHAFSYRAINEKQTIIINGEPWGQLSEATAIVSLIEPLLKVQYPQLAELRLTPAAGFNP